MKTPRVSITICTFNKPKLIRRCVNSILEQRFKDYEILLVDGGSDENTLNLLRQFSRVSKKIRIIDNPAGLPEGGGKGKWLAFKECRGEIFGVIDQDNALIGKDCLSKLVSPFDDSDMVGVACKLHLDSRDNLTNKTIALIGTDPFLAYRSLDFLINTKKIDFIDFENFRVFENSPNNTIVTGGNCFFYRRKYLEKIGGYIQDIDNIYLLAKRGYKKIAVPKTAFTHHKAIEGFLDFVKKKKKWGKEYSKKKRDFSWIPRNKIERKEFIKNIFNILAGFPMFVEAYYYSIKSKKFEWLFVPVLKYVTFMIYIAEKRHL